MEEDLTHKIHQLLQHAIGKGQPQQFSLCVQSSTISEAGNGVFIKQGVARKGDVVALYPGVVYSPDEFTLLHSQICPNNDYLAFRRSDKYVIDAKETGMSKQVWKAVVERTNASLATRKLKPILTQNIWANGHLVNHSSSKFNVRFVDWNYSKDIEGTGLESAVPNVYFGVERKEKSWMRGLVLVAVSDIPTGQELLLNYHYSTSNYKTIPTWYNPPKKSQ
jgi:hypothetical protein